VGFKLPSLRQVASVALPITGGLTAAGIGGAVVGKKAADSLFPGKIPAPQTGEDPQVTALRNKLYGEAKQFREGLPGLQANASSQIEREGNQAVATAVKGTRQGYNSRGLLYSGMREGAELGAKSRIASTMAEQRTQSNKSLQDLAAAKENTAMQVGMQGYQQALQRQDQIEQINLQNSIARTQALQQLSQVAGYAAGSIYGKSNSPSGAGQYYSAPNDNWRQSQNTFWSQSPSLGGR
jgi:hypothetical protein